MPSFGEKSQAVVDTCHLDMQKIAYFVILYFDFSAVEGHRGEEDQNQMVDEGKSHVRWPDGEHNSIPSKALDITPWPAGYDENTMLVLAGYFMLAAQLLLERGEITHKIRWGGDWDGDGDYHDNGLWDPWHFELVEI